jgi:hypothetical protein
MIPGREHERHDGMTAADTTAAASALPRLSSIPVAAATDDSAITKMTTPKDSPRKRAVLDESQKQQGVADGSSREQVEEDDAWKYSPVPLRKDEAENAEVRALAAKLAPTFERVDALFVVPTEFQRRNPTQKPNGTSEEDMDDDDDGDSIDEEMEALRYSELALRQELELASDFSNLFSKLSPPKPSPKDNGNDFGSIHEVEDRHDNNDDDENDQDVMSPRRLVPADTEADVDPAVDKAKAVEDALDVSTLPGLHSTPNRMAGQLVPPPSPLPPSAGPRKGHEFVDAVSLSPDSLLSPIPIPSTPGRTNLSSLATPASTSDRRNKNELATSSSSPSRAQLDEILIPAFSFPDSGAKHRHRENINSSAAAATTTVPSPAGGRADHEDGGIDSASASRPYTRSDHFSYLGLGREKHTWYSIDWTQSLLLPSAAAVAEVASESPQEAATASSTLGCIKEFCVTIPDSKLRAVFVGLPEQHARSTAAPVPFHPLSSPGPSRGSAAPSASSLLLQPLPVRTLTIRIRGDVLCGAVMDAVAHALVPSHNNNRSDGNPLPADETVEPTVDLSTTALLDDDESSAGGSTGVAAASSSTFPANVVHIQKRQGGHLQAIVGGTHVSSVRRRRAQSLGMEDDLSLSREEEARLVTETSIRSSSPPFFLDAQLVTHKSEGCERVLLVRVYHLQDPEAYQYDLAVEEGDEKYNDYLPDTEQYRGSNATEHRGDNGDNDDAILVRQQDVEDAVNLRQCLQLREACAMIQRVESPRKAKRIRVSPGRLSATSGLESSPSRQVLQETVSAHLLRHYLACPSVKDGNITLPSLNPQDWPLLVASWPWIKLVWDELESRDLSYQTLRTSRFGSFPALPTLDVHYCSQIRRLSREDMVVQLLKSASELEDYAREAEYACANMISLLQPTFETYGVDPPALPKPTPLTAYQLNFVAPQQTCPPWGQLVMEALNQIQAWTKDGDDAAASSIWDPGALLSAEEAAKSVELADHAVHLVLTAFQKQDDEEKGARLGRKNLQVMDRLAKMQEHERQSILMLSRSHLTCDKARKAAEDFAAKSGGVREVPLLKWSIVVGGATGTCLVTANHILFVTQLIPYIGGSKSSLFRLQDVDFVVQDAGTPSLLNPLPTVISLKRQGDEVYSFRPSSGGARLKSFLDLLQSIDVETT